MTLDLNAIKARVEAATPGPWAYDGSGVWHVNSGGPITQPLDSRDPPDGIARVGDSYPRGDNHPTENMAFIAHARQDIPALLQEIERLTAERDGAREDRVTLCESFNAQVARLTADHAALRTVVRERQEAYKQETRQSNRTYRFDRMVYAEEALASFALGGGNGE